MRIQLDGPGGGFMDPHEHDGERAIVEKPRQTTDGEGDASIRHGWEKYASDDYLNRLNSVGTIGHDPPDAPLVPWWCTLWRTTCAAESDRHPRSR